MLVRRQLKTRSVPYVAGSLFISDSFLKTPRRHLKCPNSVPRHPLFFPSHQHSTLVSEMPRENPGHEQDDDYDIYLFWPSRSNRDVSSGGPPSSPLYEV